MKFYSNGKLLLTGEYAVLDGAKALALPTRFGQSLEVKPSEDQKITWKSFDENDQIWLEAEISFKNGEFHFNQSNNPEEAQLHKRLQQILSEAHKMNPETINENKGLEIITNLDFKRRWGLGTSSTLINNIAQWFEIDAFQLLKKTFGGSGYDIAAAQNNHPITYQITEQGPSVLQTHFDPPFGDQLFFVYLNRKQNSREAIAHYRNQPEGNKKNLTDKISALTQQISLCEELQEFEMLLEIHETLISKAINLPKIKTELFSDFRGKIKSLGGWGGDFILATGGTAEQEYFRSKGYDTIFNYSEIIL